MLHEAEGHTRCQKKHYYIYTPKLTMTKVVLTQNIFSIP